MTRNLFGAMTTPNKAMTSNVNPAEALVNMVSLSRQFEMQMKVLDNAEENHRSADKVLSMNG